MATPSHAVFLSYASEDAAAAERIAEALRSASVQVWFDKAELRGGDAWDRKIRRQIRDCALFLPIVSANTEARLEAYFRREWRIAIDRLQDMDEGKPFLVPIVIDATPERSAHVPDALRSVQWTRLPGGEASPEFARRILTLLSGEATAQAADRPVLPDATAKRRWKSSRPRALPIVSLVALAAIAAGAWFAWRHLVVRPPSEALPAADKSIAVLPFVDMSEKHDQEYFGDGLAEEVLNSLVKVPGLRVIGRTSSFQFKGKNEDLRKVGATLGAAHVVEGSVRRSGSRIRVTAQLVRAADGLHEWSETYDRDAGDALEVQKDIAASLSRALQVTVDAGSESSSGARTPAAYDLYLRGLQVYERGDKAGFEQAADYFRQALDLEPSFASASESLALSHLLLADNGLVPATEGWERVRKDAQSIVLANPRSVMGHAILARVHTDYDWNWEAASHEVDVSFAIDPHNIIAHYAAGALANALGRWSDAESHFRAALSTDPLDPDIHQILGSVLAGSGRFEDAAVEHRRAIEIDPTFSYVHFELATDLLALGQPEAALREMQLESVDSAKAVGLAMAYHALGRKQDADSALAQVTRDAADVQAYEIAAAHALRGETDQAFEWLERAYRQRDYSLTFLKGDWSMKGLKTDSRYNAFLRKMNLPE
jgi:TolB-like protein